MILSFFLVPLVPCPYYNILICNYVLFSYKYSKVRTFEADLDGTRDGTRPGHGCPLSQKIRPGFGTGCTLRPRFSCFLGQLVPSILPGKVRKTPQNGQAVRGVFLVMLLCTFPAAAPGSCHGSGGSAASCSTWPRRPPPRSARRCTGAA